MEHFSRLRAARGEYETHPGISSCEQHGSFQTRQFLGAEGTVIGSLPDRCPTCAAADAVAEAARIKEMELHDRMTNAKIPRRFWSCDFDGFVPNQQSLEGLNLARSFADRWPEQKKTGESLVLIGPVGTGKTHLAVSVLKHAIRAESNGRYCTANELLREVRATWRGHGDRTEGQMIDYFGGMPLLVLDEVGATNGTDNERVILFDVLNERYERMLPTIVCGNVTMEQLAAAIDERSVDRLRENGGKAAILGGKSNRKVA